MTAVIRDVASGEETRVEARYLVGADGGRSRSGSPRHRGRRPDGPRAPRVVPVPLAGPPGPARRPPLRAVHGRRTRACRRACCCRWTRTTAGSTRRWARSRCSTACSRAPTPRSARSGPRPACPTSRSSCSRRCRSSSRPSSRPRGASGRAFLAGDAAHRMPPIGGRGMNTAIADAANLGWKLAWVVSGFAADALLDTYEAERLPIARRNLSMPLVAVSRAGGGERLRARPARGRPAPRARRTGCSRTSATATRPRRRPSTATPRRPASRTGSRDRGRRTPGCRSATRRCRRSTSAAGELRLVTAGDACGWRRSAGALSAGRHLLRGLAALVQVDGPGPAPAARRALDRHGADRCRRLARVRRSGSTSGGAVLIRPDGHVVARWATRPADRRAALAAALAAVTGYAGPGAQRRQHRREGPHALERVGPELDLDVVAAQVEVAAQPGGDGLRRAGQRVLPVAQRVGGRSRCPAAPPGRTIASAERRIEAGSRPTAWSAASSVSSIGTSSAG